jgi:uncharacterized phage protein (TIGR01671 family)
MREILFRGKREKTEKWVKGLLWHYKPKAAAIYSDDLDRLVWVHPETVGQFTGLTDKNGKMIFEGDILYEDYIGEDFLTGEENVHQRDLFLVVWEDGGFKYFQAYERLADHKKLLFGVCDDSFCDQKECGMKEIIGNIHDNPELLEANHAK